MKGGGREMKSILAVEGGIVLSAKGLQKCGLRTPPCAVLTTRFKKELTIKSRYFVPLRGIGVGI